MNRKLDWDKSPSKATDDALHTAGETLNSTLLPHHGSAPETRRHLESRLQVIPGKGISHRRLAVVLLAGISTLLQIVSVRACVPSNSPEDAEEKEVLVAVSDLQQGTVLNAGHLRKARMRFPGAETYFVGASQLNASQTFKLASSVPEGAPILRMWLRDAADWSSTPERIPPGKRLYVLPVDSTALAQQLKAGDRVDVIAQLELPEVGRVTETLLEGVEVVGVGGDVLGTGLQRDREGAISLFVSPEQVKLLAHAAGLARFSVVLRNPNDRGSTEASSAMTFNRFLASPRIQGALNSDLFKIRKSAPRIGEQP